MAFSHRPGDHDRCRRCGRPILFALTERLRLMPVDPAPVAGGTYALTERAELVPLEAEGREGYRPHAVTCRPGKRRGRS